MCGIIGRFNFHDKPIEQEEIARMCAVVAHRGPDGQGIYVDQGIGLGHRRLAIIDLSPLANQPMTNENGDFVITFNGEIYNYQKLRLELEANGHGFHSHTDTEVVLHGYEEWGESVLDKLNGMFAFAIWDSHRRRLFLARDRYGIKPLYYYSDEQCFIFGSEIKSILQCRNVRRAICLQGLMEYFTFQNLFTRYTLFQGIRMLPAGCWVRITAEQPEPEPYKYWDFDFTPGLESKISFEEATDELKRRLEQAVIRQLMSDVPLGSYLSGGMDSGSLVALASQAIPRMMTFTGGFDLNSVTGLEMNFDERDAAEQMSSVFQTEHYEMLLHSGDMARVMPRLIWHLEDPRVGMSYQNYFIARLASKFVKVVLSGGGGDELFAGYPWRYHTLLQSRTAAEFDSRCYQAWQRLMPEEDKKSFYTPEVWDQVKAISTFDIYREVYPDHLRDENLTPRTALNRDMYFEAKTFLHGLLVVEDKISSAHSLETRVPFLDNELVDFVLTLPPEFKLNIPSLLKQTQAVDGSLNSNDGKRILRAAMTGVVPKNILAKKKQGFSPPDHSWYRGETMNYIRDLLLSPRALSRGYFQANYIKRVVQQHTSGEKNHRLLLWSLLCFEWWNRIFLDRDPDLPTV